MQSSQEHDFFHQTSRFYNQPIQDFESYFRNPNENLDNRLFSNDGSQAIQFVQAPERYRTLESFTAMAGYLGNSSTISFSPLDSQTYPSGKHHFPGNTYNSLASDSCYVDDVNNLKQKISELETVMMGPGPDMVISNDIAEFVGLSQISSGTGMMSGVDVKGVLIKCAKAVADKDLSSAECLISELRPMVSVYGNPIQRLGAYMLEGLVARLSSSGSSIYRALQCKEPTSSELLSHMHLLYEICPYFKFGYMSANGAIAEAMKDENSIHIIDFQIAQGSQWFTLIQALAARPGGPPRICITGIDDSASAHARKGGLDVVGKRLSNLAESCKVPFEFHAAAISGSEVYFERLRVVTGEALAVNFALMLHHMPDESVGTINHRDRLLRLVKSLSPKVVTLVEQESNTNAVPFFPRFLETLNYYNAIFESIDVTLPRDHKERINVEQHCLAREIVNIIACEGTERVERHEILEKWKSRFVMAGFTPYPLNSFVNATIKTLLENYREHYMLKERDGALYLGWMNQDLVASCAWR